MTILPGQDEFEYEVDWWSKLFWATGHDQKSWTDVDRNYHTLQVWKPIEGKTVERNGMNLLGDPVYLII